MSSSCNCCYQVFTRSVPSSDFPPAAAVSIYNKKDLNVKKRAFSCTCHLGLDWGRFNNHVVKASIFLHVVYSMVSYSRLISQLFKMILFNLIFESACHFSIKLTRYYGRLRSSGRGYTSHDRLTFSFPLPGSQQFSHCGTETCILCGRYSANTT
jgi:hypothetical protein